MKALDKQGVPTPFIKILFEFYSNFTTKISPLNNVFTIDMKRRHLPPVDDINQAERMLVEFDETCKEIGREINNGERPDLRGGQEETWALAATASMMQ
ncbi:hypothetical protein RB195_011906 [Necator americanus]